VIGLFAPKGPSALAVSKWRGAHMAKPLQLPKVRPELDSGSCRGFQMGFTKFLDQKAIRTSLLGALLAMAGLNTACSTPDVPYNNPDPQETSWYAYQQCLAALPRTASASACDNVGATNAESSYYYTGQADTASIGWPQGGLNGLGYPNLQTVGTGPYTDPTSVSSGYRGYAAVRPAAVAVSGSGSTSFASKSISASVAANDVRSAYDLSYKEYLKTVDEKSLAELTRKWLALAASASRH
jgi:hypothetical protein